MRNYLLELRARDSLRFPPRSLNQIWRNLEHLIHRRNTDAKYLPGLFLDKNVRTWNDAPFDLAFERLAHALRNPLPIVLHRRTKSILEDMEAEAECLDKDCTLNFWRVHFQTPKGRTEMEVGELRLACQERWLGELERLIMEHEDYCKSR